MDRYHNFDLITYISKDILQYLLDTNTNIKHYAYAYHDKDNCEPHFHLLVNYKNAKTFNACLTDFTIPNVTTRCIPIEEKNKVERYEYLTHKNNLDKFQYNDNIVITDNSNFWLNCSTANNEKTLSLLEDLVQKKSFRYMVETYGRDFVINYERYSKASQLLAIEDRETFLCDSRTGEIQGTLIESIEQDIVLNKISCKHKKK